LSGCPAGVKKEAPRQYLIVADPINKKTVRGGGRLHLNDDEEIVSVVS